MCYFLVEYCFTRLVQRLFNCDKIQDNGTLDKALNSLIYGPPFYVIKYMHELQTFKKGWFLWPTCFTRRSCHRYSDIHLNINTWLFIFILVSQKKTETAWNLHILTVSLIFYELFLCSLQNVYSFEDKDDCYVFTV